ncbi:alpha/beta fold hydrolase [Micromonospora tulbaghiae]|uniref:alpha/beta fold hydrolase n=1 Tax=Micromonospora tulbaghiae TaxID=479978 RepID=UPI0033F05EFC
MTWYPVGETEHDGERLAVHRGAGSGPALVFVHGLEDSWQTWRPFANELTAGSRWTPYALDLPWRAGADYGWVHRTGPSVLLRRALELLPQPPAVLVGHSFGANGVLELLAATDRPPVAGAVLLAPYFRPSDDPVTWQLFERELARFRGVIGEGVRRRMGERGRTLPTDLVGTVVAKALDRVGPLGFVALLRQFVTTADLDLSAVREPTLVLSGALDPALAGPRADALLRAMPSATAHTRPDGGHFCHLEQVTEVAGEVRRFLATLPVPTLV